MKKIISFVVGALLLSTAAWADSHEATEQS